MFRKIYNRISMAIKRSRYRRLYYRLFWLYASKGECTDVAIEQADTAFYMLTGTGWEEWQTCETPQVSEKRHHIVPKAYADYYYLRDLDLHAERLGDCPHAVCEEMCTELIALNMLFKSREEAEAVRSLMLDAYFKTSNA